VDATVGKLSNDVLNVLPVQAVWYLKTRALTLKDWMDDTEMDDEVGSCCS
jgi:hypothetical protein